MNGPEHYSEAEMLLGRAANAEGMAHADELIGRAHAHAALALAAATVATRALGPQEQWGGHSFECSGEWQEVTGQ